MTSSTFRFLWRFPVFAFLWMALVSILWLPLQAEEIKAEAVLGHKDFVTPDCNDPALPPSATLCHGVGVTVDPRSGKLFVADGDNNRVQKLTPDGQPILAWGQAGAGPGQFNLPWGISIDRQGRVYVADWRNGRVQQFSPDGSYLASFGDRDGEGRLDRPAGVGVDSAGNVYVSDYGQDIVQVYEPDGRQLHRIVGHAATE